MRYSGLTERRCYRNYDRTIGLNKTWNQVLWVKVCWTNPFSDLTVLSILYFGESHSLTLACTLYIKHKYIYLQILFKWSDIFYYFPSSFVRKDSSSRSSQVKRPCILAPTLLNIYLSYPYVILWLCRIFAVVVSLLQYILVLVKPSVVPHSLFVVRRFYTSMLHSP